MSTSSSALDSLYRGSTILLAGASGALGGRVLARVLAAGGKAGIVVRRPGDATRVAAEYAGRPVLAVHAAPDDGEAAAGLVKGVEDSITLENIYDSVLLGTNDYTALFTEDPFLVLKRFHDSRAVTVPFSADGATHGGVAILSNGTSAGVEV